MDARASQRRKLFQPAENHGLGKRRAVPGGIDVIQEAGHQVTARQPCDFRHDPGMTARADNNERDGGGRISHARKAGAPVNRRRRW